MTKKDLVGVLKKIRDRAQKTIDNEDCQFDVMPSNNAMIDMQKIAIQAIENTQK